MWDQLFQYILCSNIVVTLCGRSLHVPAWFCSCSINVRFDDVGLEELQWPATVLGYTGMSFLCQAVSVRLDIGTDSHWHTLKSCEKHSWVSESGYCCRKEDWVVYWQRIFTDLSKWIIQNRRTKRESHQLLSVGVTTFFWFGIFFYCRMLFVMQPSHLTWAKDRH